MYVTKNPPYEKKRPLEGSIQKREPYKVLYEENSFTNSSIEKVLFKIPLNLG